MTFEDYLTHFDETEFNVCFSKPMKRKQFFMKQENCAFFEITFKEDFDCNDDFLAISASQMGNRLGKY